jgi:hypothetical protein
MAYSKFSLEEVILAFTLEEERKALFLEVVPVQPSAWLLETLSKTNIMPAKSEKARSELIITPILLDMAEHHKDLITIFSGEELDGDSSKGLAGECDYILSKSPQSFSLKAPVFGLVEAKQNIVENSMGQCVAQMLGAQIFNERKNNAITQIFGCVSNGDVWHFLRLVGKHLTIDTQKYYLDNLALLLGVLQHIILKN